MTAPPWTDEQARDAVAAYACTALAALAVRLGLDRDELRRRLVEAGAVIRAPGARTPAARATHGDKLRARAAADPRLRERLAEGGRLGCATRFAYLRTMSADERAEYDRLRLKYRMTAAEALAEVRRVYARPRAA